MKRVLFSHEAIFSDYECPSILFIMTLPFHFHVSIEKIHYVVGLSLNTAQSEARSILSNIFLKIQPHFYDLCIMTESFIYRSSYFYICNLKVQPCWTMCTCKHQVDTAALLNHSECSSGLFLNPFCLILSLKDRF